MTESSPKHERRVDLHVHTNASDGVYSPREVVRLARDAGLAAIAVTDHDTVAGLAEAAAEGSDLGVEVVPGIELTAYAGRTEIHVVGLFIDTSEDKAEVLGRVAALKDARLERMKRMIEKLRGLGVEVDLDEVLAETPDGAVGRPHLATVLARHGFVADEGDAFASFLRLDGPAHVRKKELTVREAIGIVLDLGGVAILAHAGVSRLDERIPEFAEAGLAGLEVWHAKHTRAQERFYARLAEKHGLSPAGGSDFHGPGRSEAKLGVPEIGYEVLEALRERHAAASGTRG